MAGIRVRTGDLRVEVNDRGECITLPFSDQSFPNRVFAMTERLQTRAEEARAEEAALRAAYPGEADELPYLKETAALNEKLHRALMAEVDGVFGEGTCRKVFGDIVPEIGLFEDFFRQLTPFFEQYGRERAEKLAKYSPARTGDV